MARRTSLAHCTHRSPKHLAFAVLVDHYQDINDAAGSRVNPLVACSTRYRDESGHEVDAFLRVVGDRVVVS
jgi:hypothetical protein